MKILGLDEQRTIREGNALKFFELERVPNSDWIKIFESLFTVNGDEAWIEGYCIVTHCPTSEMSIRLMHLQSKCEEANSIFMNQHSSP